MTFPPPADVRPKGKEWWMERGEWDHLAASYMEQIYALEKVVKRIQQIGGWKEQRRKQLEILLKRYNLTITRELKALRKSIKEAVKKYATLKAKLNQAEAAINRGALALSGQHWENLRKEERRKIARPFPPEQAPKVKIPKQLKPHDWVERRARHRDLPSVINKVEKES